jgi:peptidoglycan/xylan/chitin deacetylase (PgdA/CDA1 family)
MQDLRPAGIVISLDFELRWGVHDRYGLNFDAYRENLEKVPLIVPELLKLFADRNIRATWATVGAIGCKNWDDYFARAPQPPKYTNRALAVTPRYADLDPDGTLHFAPHLLEAIVASEGQELGTHTFSHLYAREEGVTQEDLVADLAAVGKLYADRFGFTPRSLVFPRNENAFLDAVRSSYIRIWRGNERAWYYERQGAATNGLLPRALRLVDSLSPFRTRAAAVERDMTRASLFLRFNLPELLWTAQVTRITREVKSLRPGQIFHMWFHPHNLGESTSLRLARFEQILDFIADAQYRKRAVSYTMDQLDGWGIASKPADASATEAEFDREHALALA